MVAPGTGEVLARGDFGFMEEKAVDSEEFVKVYLDGVRKYGELKKAGALLFEFVYRELSGKNAKEKIILSYLMAKRWKPDLAERTYFTGMNELLAKQFLFPYSGGRRLLRERSFHLQWRPVRVGQGL